MNSDPNSFTIHHLPFTIHHSPFTIHHLPFTIHHSPFTIYHSPFTIHHLPFTIHHMAVVSTEAQRQETGLSNRASPHPFRVPQYAPLPKTTAGIVRSKISTSFQKLCSAMYCKSSSTHRLKSRSLRPETCCRPVIPGMALRRPSSSY